jgi:hypothetical protein
VCVKPFLDEFGRETGKSSKYKCDGFRSVHFRLEGAYGNPGEIGWLKLANKLHRLGSKWTFVGVLKNEAWTQRAGLWIRLLFRRGSRATNLQRAPAQQPATLPLGIQEVI